MPDNIIPITNLSEHGLIEDTPSVTLPPNAFSDCQNVRFRHGAVRKFPSEVDEHTAFSNIRHVAFWPSTAGNRIVVVSGNLGIVTVSVINEDGSSTGFGPYTRPAPPAGYRWQHTIFNGGHHLILNNGRETPFFLQADISGLTDLPNWDSYLVEEEVLQFVFDGRDIASGGAYTVTNQTLEENSEIIITRVPRNSGIPITSFTVTLGPGLVLMPDGTDPDVGTIDSVTATGFRFIPAGGTGGDTFRLRVRSPVAISVTAGVIRSYGNLLVAGNLMETNGRTLVGTVRTSDVAAPGEIPQNWNPFRDGANTADEFILSTTGTVRDMVELQGNLYVYTDTSIHSVQQTGGPIPFAINVVTESYGASNIDSVIEMDGKHIVFGSDDVYVFAGHPGSISSIVDGRVRNFFRNAAVSHGDIRIVRFNRWDELWFWSPSEDIAYIWNYRLNNWTKRVMRDNTLAGVETFNNLLFTASTDTDGSIYTVDGPGYLDSAYIERDRLALTPEFDTETLIAMALLVDGDDTVDINVRGSNTPGDLDGTTDSPTKAFDIANDYKTDIRVHGRFLNYRLSHATTNSMNLSGMQFDVLKGGTR